MGLILVIDDDMDNREFIAALLERHGHVVATASQGERGLALLDAIAPARPDLVLTDMMMPILDGLGFLRAYGERPPPRAPVVAMSGFSTYLEQALALGAMAALPKPLATGELLAIAAEAAAGRVLAPGPLDQGPDPEVERRRLEALTRLSLEGPSHAALGPFVERAARVFEVETCLVSIVTDARQLWTAGCNIPASYADARGGPREESFCTHAVVARTALIVQDALDNPLFSHNPFVTHEGIRFYAGVPLVSEHGSALGTLCLLDTRPRVFGHFDLELLSILSRRVVSALERRSDEYIDLELEIPGRACIVDLAAVEAWRSAAAHRLCALVVLDCSGPLEDAKAGLEERFDRAWIGRLGPRSLGLIVPAVSPRAARDAALDATPEARVAATDLTHYVGLAVAAFGDLEAVLAAHVGADP